MQCQQRLAHVSSTNQLGYERTGYERSGREGFGLVGGWFIKQEHEQESC